MLWPGGNCFTLPPPRVKRTPRQVCNALRNDLNHPNEYVRGCTLRFLCKLREPELLEPLIPTIKVQQTEPAVIRNIKSENDYEVFGFLFLSLYIYILYVDKRAIPLSGTQTVMLGDTDNERLSLVGLF